jgi:peptide subunit release factor 1 (eRF1)
MASRITTEIGTVSNIKCKHTQKDVRAALKRLKAFMQRLSAVPDTGVALFASADDVIGVVPDAAIDHNDYICGKTFEIEPIQARFRHKTDQLYGWCLFTGAGAEYSDSGGERVRRLTRPGGKQGGHLPYASCDTKS